MPFAAILREVDQLHDVSTRLEGLADQHSPKTICPEHDRWAMEHSNPPDAELAKKGRLYERN